MSEAQSLREQAKRCIRLAQQTLDPEAGRALRQLAEEYQKRAEEIDAVPPAG